MSEILFAANIVLPMAILLALGYIFKKSGFFTRDFVKRGNKLCFYVLLSCSLFKNLYDSVLDEVPYAMIVFTVLAILAEFVLSVFFARAVSDKRNQIGVIIQGVVRSNFAYVGIPLSTLMFNESELISQTSNEISILSIFVIPMFNILAVTALTLYGDTKENGRVFSRTINNLRKNPIIISIVLGIAVLLFRMAVPQSAFFIKNNLGFVYKVVGYLAQMSTPFALLLVGAGLDFSHSVSNMKKLMSVVAVKNLVFPGVVMLVAYLTGLFNAIDFAVMISVFASPTAVSSAVMAAELGGDEDLANEIVIYTTMFSIISLLIIIYVLKTVGCL